jgi:hypothetical protein
MMLWRLLLRLRPTYLGPRGRVYIRAAVRAICYADCGPNTRQQWAAVGSSQIRNDKTSQNDSMPR